MKLVPLYHACLPSAAAAAAHSPVCKEKTRAHARGVWLSGTDGDMSPPLFFPEMHPSADTLAWRKIGTEEDITAEQERGLEQRKSCAAKLHTAAILSACLNATCGFFLLFSLQKDCCVVPCPHPCITEITKMRFVCVCMCVCLRWRCCSCIS